jgi:glutaconate CoA-transferase subunit B
MTESAAPAGDPTRSETMIAAAARELAGQHVCFVGIGLPNVAVNLALRTVAPELVLIYEAGAYGAQPARLPLSIGDPTIVTGSLAVMSQADLFGLYLQGGLVDVGFLGAAQIDRFGTINTTVIGDYAAPRVRLPGSGGAIEIATHSHEVFVIMRQSRRSFVERIDFRTSPGHAAGGSFGPSVVVTDLGVYHFGPDGEMRLDMLHPGATLDDVRAATGWDVHVSPQLARTPPPSAEELRLMREVLDPAGRYRG